MEPKLIPLLDAEETHPFISQGIFCIKGLILQGTLSSVKCTPSVEMSMTFKKAIY